MPAKPAVLEAVRFRLNEGVSEADFLAAAAKSDDFIQRQPGFIKRILARTEEGEWMDLLEWESMAAARAAFEKFNPEDPSLAAFTTAINFKSTTMTHYTPRHRCE